MGCIKNILSNPIIQPIADIVATATGNPELIPLINAGITTGSNLANGQSFGKSLGQGAISGGEAFAGNELAGAAANYFPETAASLGYTDTGGNTLTDILGHTSGAGSFAGPGTIGGDIMSGGGKLSSILSGGGASAPGTGALDGTMFDYGADAASPSSLSSLLSGAGGVNSGGTGALTGTGFDYGTPTGTGFGQVTPLSASATSLAAPTLNLSTGGGASAYGGGAAPSGYTGSSYGPTPPAGATPGGFSKYGPLATSLLGGGISLNANSGALSALKTAQGNSLAAIAPYQASGAAANAKLSDLLGTGSDTGAAGYGSLTKPFAPGDLTQDPGYKFNLDQGELALNRKNAASGNYFSGGALKEAEQFGQGLADNTYNNAFQRNQAQKAQTYGELAGQAGAGQNAAGTAANIYGNTGTAKANARISGSNILNNSLSSILSGSGMKRPVNIGGQVVYI